MNKFAKFIIIPMMCLAANFASAANIKDYPTVAVMNFGNKAITSRGLRGHDMSMATEYAIYQLSACGWFDLIDYEQLNTIAQMHNINMSGFVDPRSAAQMGKISGAQFMVIGNVTGLTAKKNIVGIGAHNIRGGNTQYVVNANVALRIVDVETARIVVAGIGKGSSTSTMTEIGFTKYRNRKVVSENIYDSVGTQIVNERRTGKSNSSDSGFSYDNHSSSDSGSSYNKGSSYSNDSINISDAVKTMSRQELQETESSLRRELDRMYLDYHKNNRDDHYSNNSWERGNSSGSSYSDTKEYVMPVKNDPFTLLGDVNEDGRINQRDLDLLKEYLVGLADVNKVNTRNADIDQSGRIDITDVAQLKLYLGGNYEIKQPGNSKGYTNVPVNKYGSSSSSSNNYGSDQDNWGNRESENVHGEAGSLSMEDERRRREMNSAQYGEYNRSYQAEKNNESGYENESGYSNRSNTSNDAGYSNRSDSSYDNANMADNRNTFSSRNQNIYYEREAENYSIVIGTVEVSDVQVRNAISKAVRDAIYGNMGIMTTLNNGKKLKIKTGF